MTNNTMREGKLWACLHDSIHEAYKKLSTTGTSNEYHTMLDSIASKIADDVDARFLQAAQSVPVLGPPVAWVNINKQGDITRTVSRRDNWCTTPVFEKPKTSIPAAELASLREKAAEADELRKDAERYRKLRGWMSSNVKEGWGRVTDLSAVFCYVSWQEGDSYLDNLPECNVGLMQKDAAIAQGQTK